MDTIYFYLWNFRFFSSFSKSVLKPPSDKTLGDALKILDDFSRFSRNRTAWNQARDAEPVGLGRGGRGQPRSRSPNHYNRPGERPDGSRVYFQLPNGQLSNSRIEVERAAEGIAHLRELLSGEFALQTHLARDDLVSEIFSLLSREIEHNKATEIRILRRKLSAENIVFKHKLLCKVKDAFRFGLEVCRSPHRPPVR